jgi:hypothetical protein
MKNSLHLRAVFPSCRFHAEGGKTRESEVLRVSKKILEAVILAISLAVAVIAKVSEKKD